MKLKRHIQRQPILVKKKELRKIYPRLMVADPGVNGGLVWNDSYGYLHACSMPETLPMLANRIREVSPQFFLVERVRTSPQMGVVSAGTFMLGVGRLEGILTALNIQWRDVTPRTWMKFFELGKVKDHATPRLWKKHLLAEAKLRAPRVFQGLNLTNSLKISDAVLLWFFAKHIHTLYKL